MLRSIADGFLAAPSTLCQAAADLAHAVKEKAKTHPVARRLMTAPGVGSLVALNFVALVDQPSRFGRGENVGAFPGLTPRRYQSGEMDWSGRISKCGYGTMWSLLFEAATWSVPLHSFHQVFDQRGDREDDQRQDQDRPDPV